MCLEHMALMHGAIAPSLAIESWLSDVSARSSRDSHANQAMLGSLLWIKEINGATAPDLVISNFDSSLMERLQMQAVALHKTL